MDFSAVQLIHLVREMPQIYDSSLADFKIPEKKDQAWYKVAQKLNSTADECRKRWRTMRERYTRELKRYKSSDSACVKQECPPDAVTANVSWSLFDEMSFLYDHVKLRKARYMFDKATKVKVLVDDPDPMHEEQHIEQNSSDATTAGQVYAKFKVQSIDGTDGENRILVNEEYKDYGHMQSVEHLGAGHNDEQEVVAETGGEEEEEDEEDEEEGEEFLADDPHDHHQSSAASGPRIILTAPRDNSPSPQLPPPLIHHTTILSGGGPSSGSTPKSLKRKHPGSGANTSTSTTTMTIDPVEHSDIISMHHHQHMAQQSVNAGPGQVPHIHHVSPMQAGAILNASLHQPQDDNDFFCSAVAGSLKQLNRLYNIKAKVEIYKVLEKFIEMQHVKH